MTNRMTGILGRFRAQLGSESGTAVTEMVIGLPIFIMIFSGMGMLYRFNHEALVVKGKAYSELWKEDAEGSLLGMIPAVGALTSIGSIGDVFQNGLSAGGIYIDSGVKAKIPATLMPGSGIDPKYTLTDITGGDDSMINYRLLNDLANPTFNGGGFAAAFSSLIQTTGAGLAIGAGIRYGASQASATHTADGGVWGQIDYESGEIDLPARTAATHRVAPVVLTRLEFTNTERFDVSIPVFEINPNFEDEATTAGSSCQTQSDSYNSCLQANNNDADACEGSKPSDSCGSIGGSNPIGNFDTSWCGTLGC